MKLTTLLEYQRCFEILKEAEGNRRLTGAEYVSVIRAKSKFDGELDQQINPIQIEVTQ